MKIPDFDTASTPDDDRLDAQARQAHAAAQGALSPRVRAQLQQRRRAALAAPRRGTGVRWVPTLAVAATLALTVGLGLRLWSPPASGPEPDAMAQGDPAASSGARGAASTDTRADTPPALGAQGDTAPTQVVAAGGAAGGDTHGAPSGTGGTEGPTAAAAASVSVEDEVDAIAALLAAPEAGEADGARDDARDAAADASGEDDALLAALEESPDFYLWLGADDGAGVEAL